MSDQDPDYRSAIAAHLDEESENSLSRAYELGRHALSQGFGILDMLSLYESIQKELVLAAPVSEQARIATAIANFFRELFSPFEMSLRGYRDANSELRRLNQDLAAAYAELQAQQVRLVQSAKMASLGQLVAGVAHEINNPLAFIVSHLRTALTSLSKAEAEIGEPPVAAREQLERARNRLQECELGAARIQNLVVKLRTFSRLDEGERKEASVRECVSSVLTILEHRFVNRIRIETHFGYPDVVECFPALLNQAIMNLVSNAIEAIERDGVISISTGADADNYVVVVRDTGHGIPENLRQRVFEPFFTTKPPGQGTGLGLSITYSIAERHGGGLELKPAEGGGTVATFRLRMPTRSWP
ncbi:MAG TPA: ATP-binding protein [Polyangiaceae bacterium]|nr:ATP-binding protein [Polyangiaceae bacterium]